MRPTPGPDSDFDLTPPPVEAHRRVAEAARAQAAADRARARAERLLSLSLARAAAAGGRGARLNEVRSRLALDVADEVDHEAQAHDVEALHHDSAAELVDHQRTFAFASELTAP